MVDEHQYRDGNTLVSREAIHFKVKAGNLNPVRSPSNTFENISVTLSETL